MTDTTTTLATQEQSPTDLDTPWTLRFDRDGTEDFGVICDADDREIVSSQHSKTCWLPEGDDGDVPVLVHQMRVMAAAPRMLAALERVLGWCAIPTDQRTTGDIEAVVADAIAEAKGLAA